MQNAAVLPRPGRWLAAAIVVLATLLPACDNGPQTAASVTLAATSTNLYVGQTTQVTPTVKDKSGKTLTDRIVTYQSTAPSVAAVSSVGQVLAMSPGSANITATVDGVTASISIVVALVPVSKVVMSKDTASVAAATTLQLSATPQDSAGHSLVDRTVTWSTSDATIATVSSSGLVSGIATGTATITASAEGKSGTTRITVTPAAVASIDVSPSTASVPEGATQQLTATAKDAAGRTLTGRPFTWTSSDVTKATVSSAGLVTGVAAGVANILVTSGSIVGSASVLVIHPVAKSVRITPDSASMVTGDTLRLSASATDSAGRSILVRSFGWRSLNPAVATVDSTGKVTGVGNGVTGIIASRDNAADTARITVGPPPPTGLTLSPSPASLGVGRTGRLLVSAVDAFGQPITGLTLTYQSSDSTILNLDGTGLMTGVTAGNAVLTVTAGTLSASAYVVVSPTVVAGVLPDSSSLTLAAGASYTLHVKTVDTFGNTLYGRTLAFSSADSTIATVSATGTVTAIKSGTTTITIVSEGSSNGVTVIVP